jgi:hypothetical protein
MARFNFCFIVEIAMESSLGIYNENPVIGFIDEQMEKADNKCDSLIRHLHDSYFPELAIDLDKNSSGYLVSDRIRENLYIITIEGAEKARFFLDKIDKILYDFRDGEIITINDNNAYIDLKFFAAKVKDFNRDIVTYDLLKNIEFQGD